jgi:mRNA-degrading endonuclease toxin of MazEF toxin-antitoxin module
VNAAYPWCLVAAVGVTIGDVPMHVPFEAGDKVMDRADVGVRAERLGCIPKAWLREYIGQLSVRTMRHVEQAISRALALS